MTYRYLEAVRQLLRQLEATQNQAIEQAANLVIAAYRSGGAVFCSEIGHGIQGDFLNRAGGLAALQPFGFTFAVQDPLPACLANRPAIGEVDRECEAVRLAVRGSSLRAGDVMVIGSVSGRNKRPVELALACAQVGVRTIGLTSLAYTQQVTSLHPSGKRLYEAVDVAIDIGAPYGDAAVEIPGIEVAVLPVSGVAFAVAGWMIWERVMTRMAEEGDPPTVFMSVNRPGGQDYYEQARRQLNDRGY